MARKLEISAVFKGVDKISSVIRRILSRTKRLVSSMSKGFKKIDRITSKLGRTMAAGLGAGINVAKKAMIGLAGATAGVVHVGATFEKSLVTAAVKFPGKIRKGSEAFKELEDKARQVGSTTEFSASQAAEGLNFLAMAGFDAKQSIGALDTVVNLATVANVDLATASDIATDTLGAMGLASDDAATQSENLRRVVDVMAKTTVSANTNLEQLFEAYVAGGPQAVQAGESIETFSAMVGKMANAGIKGERAGTALRNMYLRLQAPTGKARTLVKKFVGEIEDKQTGKMISMTKVLDKLTKRMGKLSDVKKAEIMSVVFGLRSIGPASIALQEGASNIEAFAKELDGAGGTAEEMASTIRNTTSGSIDSLKSTVEGVIISIFKLKNSAIKGTVDSMTQWIRKNEEVMTTKLNDFINDLITNFDEYVSKVKTAGIVVGIIGGIIIVVKALTAALTLLNLVTAANPIVFIVTAVVAAVAAIAALIIAHADEIRAFFADVVDWVTEKWLFVVDVFDETVKILSDIWEGVSNFIISVFGPVIKFFQDAWGWITDIFDAAVSYLMESGAIAWITEAALFIMQSWEKVKNFFSDLWTSITDIFNRAVDAIMEFFQPLLNMINKVVGFAKTGFSFMASVGEGDDEAVRKALGIDQAVQAVSPAERSASALEERQLTTTDRTEVTIRDESGRAEVTKGGKRPSFAFKPTGSF